MKIISKFHDYYDSASAFYDDSLLLKRKTEIVSLNSIKNPLPYNTIQVAASYGRRVVGSMDRLATIDFLYFCGKVYPLFCIFNSSSYWIKKGNVSVRIEERSDQVYFSTLEELVNECKRQELGMGYSKRVEEKIKKYNQIIKENLAAKVDVDIFRNVSAPYFMTEGSSIVIYPVLKNLTRSFKMDAFAIYQEIEMFLGGVMGSSEKEIIEISDVDKRNSKGFDNYSFKKRKAS